MTKFKVRFVLNNAGACGQFRAIQGIRTRHLFYATGRAGFELKFEGTMPEYELLMKDLFGRLGHSIAIFVYPEIPDVLELQTEIARLRAGISDPTLPAMTAERDQALLDLATAKERCLHLEGQVRDITTSADAFAVPRAGASGQPSPGDLGLPVGPGPLIALPDHLSEVKEAVTRTEALFTTLNNLPLDTRTPQQKRKDTLAQKAKDMAAKQNQSAPKKGKKQSVPA